MLKRGSGVLLHITSLPSPYGIGDLGPGAYHFADFLAQSGQSFWQILPLNPIDPVYGNSPYHSISAFANNLLLISPELLLQEGLVPESALRDVPDFPRRRVDYHRVIAFKHDLFRRAYERFKVDEHPDYRNFDAMNAYWLDDFALFTAVKEYYNHQPWSDWPREIRDRQPGALQTLRGQLHERIAMEKFLQYVFSKQWFSLKHYCNQRAIQLFGDMPIYVDYDGVDVWKNPGLFKLGKDKRPSCVAGVPPDYFSETGQRWGNPVYQWNALKKTRYTWWVQRIQRNVQLFDLLRIDHFRGFVAYWEIPAEEKTAINGKWVAVPAEDFFTVLLEHFPDAPIIAEDLGIITPDVKEVMNRFRFPGMKVLLFAFGDDLATNPYTPHNHIKNCVLYTGTHDNNTVRGWYEHEVSPDVKQKIARYLGHAVPLTDVHWVLIRCAMTSVADMVIFPMQDILGLSAEDRMNKPSTVHGNWEWRLLPEEMTPSLSAKLRDMTRIYGRC